MRRSTASCRRCWRARSPMCWSCSGSPHAPVTCASRPARATAISRVVPDAAGHRPRAGTIAPGAAATLALRIPARRLVKAARSTGREGRAVARRRPLPLQLSVLARDRGGGASRTARRSPPSCMCRKSARTRHAPRAVNLRPAVRAGEAIVLAAIAARAHRPLTALLTRYPSDFTPQRLAHVA